MLLAMPLIACQVDVRDARITGSDAAGSRRLEVDLVIPDIVEASSASPQDFAVEIAGVLVRPSETQTISLSSKSREASLTFPLPRGAAPEGWTLTYKGKAVPVVHETTLVAEMLSIPWTLWGALMVAAGAICALIWLLYGMTRTAVAVGLLIATPLSVIAVGLPLAAPLGIATIKIFHLVPILCGVTYPLVFVWLVRQQRQSRSEVAPHSVTRSASAPRCHACRSTLPTIDMGRGAVVTLGAPPILFGGVICGVCHRVECSACKGRDIQSPCSSCGGAVMPAYAKYLVD